MQRGWAPITRGWPWQTHLVQQQAGFETGMEKQLQEADPAMWDTGLYHASFLPYTTDSSRKFSPILREIQRHSHLDLSVFILLLRQNWLNYTGMTNRDCVFVPRLISWACNQRTAPDPVLQETLENSSPSRSTWAFPPECVEPTEFCVSRISPTPRGSKF